MVNLDVSAASTLRSSCPPSLFLKHISEQGISLSSISRIASQRSKSLGRKFRSSSPVRFSSPGVWTVGLDLPCCIPLNTQQNELKSFAQKFLSLSLSALQSLWVLETCCDPLSMSKLKFCGEKLTKFKHKEARKE